LANSLPSVVERAEHGGAPSLQHARVGEVVDVLGGATEMHQLERRGIGAGVLQPLAHPVLDRLDVVVDARLDRLDLCGGRLRR
jgi:hypothetical protein